MNDPERDFSSANPSLVVRLGGGALVLSGVLHLLLGLQSILTVRWLDAMAYGPYALMALGVVAIGVGWKVTLARDWAASAGLALAIVLTLGTAAWTALNFGQGIFSLLSFGTVSVSVVSIVGTALAIDGCRRATAARRRLRAEGLDIGI